MPLFSVILPAKKVTTSLLLSIVSCTNALIDDSEILVGLQSSDSSSPDGLRLIEKLCDTDSRIHIIDTKAASNLPQNLNILLRSTNSHFAIRHDDDDLMHPGRLRSLGQRLPEIRKALFVGQPYKIFRQGSRGTSKLVYPSVRDMENRIRLLSSPCFAHPALTINLHKLTHSYDELYDYAQDYKLYVDNYSSGAFLGISGLATYYNAPTSIRGTVSQKRLSQLQYHDRCMHSLWELSLGVSVDPGLVTLFRRLHISSDDISLQDLALLKKHPGAESSARLYALAVKSIRESY